MSGPARWRLVTEGELMKESDGGSRWRCDGDGVDLCRAPASWVAEHDHERSDGAREIRIVSQRCPDHIPMRALRSLSTMPAPMSEPRASFEETSASLPETIETPIAPPTAVETEPAITDVPENTSTEDHVTEEHEAKEPKENHE